ncbi:hypothetical protein BD410DRAFT_623545 [Rickenella mellea]|uniref:Uncharacterized protein n=1 Tax=Rickenella mellea TaxID=50990 RepID=A0A4Y7PNG9_9AGAM|nr:hypothetical protein BD410DRAFT_623545 [Rickenella mellea]
MPSCLITPPTPRVHGVSPPSIPSIFGFSAPPKPNVHVTLKRGKRNSANFVGLVVGRMRIRYGCWEGRGGEDGVEERRGEIRKQTEAMNLREASERIGEGGVGRMLRPFAEREIGGMNVDGLSSKLDHLLRPPPPIPASIIHHNLSLRHHQLTLPANSTIFVFRHATFDIAISAVLQYVAVGDTVPGALIPAARVPCGVCDDIRSSQSISRRWWGCGDEQRC